jgi:VanZ family protein
MSLEARPKIVDWQDKLHHLLAYAILFWCLLSAYSEQYRLWTLAISLAVFSGLVEVAQSYTGYRQADLMDLLANCMGILLIALLSLLRRRM